MKSKKMYLSSVDGYFDFQSLRQSSEKLEEWTLGENVVVDTEIFCSHRAVTPFIE